MKPKHRKSIDEIFAERKPIDAALRKAAREAARIHKMAGQPLVVWQNGKTAFIPPEKIKVSIKPASRKKTSAHPIQKEFPPPRHKEREDR